MGDQQLMRRLGEAAVELGRIQAAIPAQQDAVTRSNERFSDLSLRCQRLQNQELTLEQKVRMAEVQNQVLRRYVENAKRFAWAQESACSQYEAALDDIESD